VTQFRDSQQDPNHIDEPGFSPAQRLARTEQLLETHQATVFRYAYRLIGCASTAEDITQEVFLRAFRSIHQLRDDAAARGWLLTIARNEFLRYCRKKGSQDRLVDPRSFDVVDELQPPAIDHQEWVARALEELPEEFRLVILMYYFEELSYAQIAEQLKIPMGTLMSRLSRAKTHLKTALDKSQMAQD
jgi:RNA polymerase sigma-70 factor, ECF subfamily